MNPPRFRPGAASSVVLALLSCLPQLVIAGAGFLPDGALRYEEERLANGLRLVVQQSDNAAYVAMRLVVKTGTDHYPCDDRELPHLVEHLLFSANERVDETTLDAQVAGWGGSINAFTWPEYTEIVLDVHSRFRQPAIELLATMIAGFSPGEDDVLREVAVIEQESGVEHSPLRLWWSRQPFTQRASTRFLRDAGALCDAGIAPVRHLKAGDVRRQFDAHYVPGNMVLILAGNIDEEGRTAARDAFGALPAREIPSVAPLVIRMPDAGDYRSGWLSGIANLDQPTLVGFSPFTDWEGYYALSLVADWLNERLFRDLRTDSGIAYTPVAELSYHGTALSMTMSVETRPADTDFTLGYLDELANTVREQGIPPGDFERLRTSALLAMARDFERTSDRADYLSAAVREIEQGGLFDTEVFYSGLQYDEFRRLVARDWPARHVVFNDAPPVSWTARSGLVLGGIGLLALLAGRRLWRRFSPARAG